MLITLILLKIVDHQKLFFKKICGKVVTTYIDDCRVQKYHVSLNLNY